MIFHDPPHGRTRMHRLHNWWESIRHSRQDATTVEIERHQRMVRALGAAANDAGRDAATDQRNRPGG